MRKIGLVEAYSGNFDKDGFYNSQITGLAKALSKLNFYIEIYKYTKIKQNKIYNVENYNIKVNIISSFSIKKTSFIKTKTISKDLDYIIYFSGMVLNLKKIYNWCNRNSVIFYPYIGTIESSNCNRIVRMFMNKFYRKSIPIYKECVCFAKTEELKNMLLKNNVQNVELMPVGLDIDLLMKDYKKYSKNKLKYEFGYKEDDEIILFIGRLEHEKNPLEIINIYKRLFAMNEKYKLIIIGNGNMKSELLSKIKNISGIKYIEEVKNIDIWKYYYISNWFINLNKKEIFGMSILESMYYDCKVIAISAPGPNMIISNNNDSFLIENSDQVIDIILSNKKLKNTPHKKIIDCFLWEKTIYSLKEHII